MPDEAKRDDAPKGHLVAVGGNEDKRSDRMILKRLVELKRGGVQHIEIIPTASRYARSLSDDYIDAFRELGVDDVGVLDIRERKEAEYKEYLERLAKADAVFLTGGDQVRLTTILGGTELARGLAERYQGGGIIAGTSAGAAAMSSTMIAGGDEGRMRKGSVRMAPGLGFLRDCVIDTHFLDRGRVGRLLEVIASNPGHVGLGIGEDTAAAIEDGRYVEAWGSGVVVVIDGSAMDSTNLPSIQPDEPIAVQGIRVHTLAPGYRFDLVEKKYLGRPKR